MAANERVQPTTGQLLDDDTIDLGALIKGLFDQWKLIASLTIAITLAALVYTQLMPNQYRVEINYRQPARQAVQTLLAQTVVPVTMADINRRFLDNLRSFAVQQAAYRRITADDSSPLSEAAQVSAVQQLAGSLAIESANANTSNDETLSYDNLVVSLETSRPEAAKIFLDELVTQAAHRTLLEIKADIEAARDIEIERTQSRIIRLEQAAQTALENRVYQLEQALALAESLNIVDPTDWVALVHGRGNVQIIDQASSNPNDLFLQGTRILSAQLESLRSDFAFRQFERSYTETEVVGMEWPARLSDSLTQGNVFISTPQITSQTISLADLKGSLASLQSVSLSIDQASLIDEETQARIPANPSGPNRKLITLAAFVLGGFLAVFVALIRLAVRQTDES